MAMLKNSPIQSMWNIDGARMYDLDQYFKIALSAYISKNYEALEAYLDVITMILYAKISDTEYKEVEKLFFEANDFKDKIRIETEDLKRYRLIWEYKNRLRRAFMTLHRLGKEHGFYFREGLDPTRAVLRR